jgi:hypothetical protein
VTGSRSGTASADALLAPVRQETRRLDPDVRAQLERSFGTTFGDVLVHAGEASGRTADDLDASAFTVGRHIVFGPGRYDPASTAGRTLLAHELAHVVQQRRGGGDPDAGERQSAAELTRGAEAQGSPGHADAGASASVGVARAGKTEAPTPPTVEMFEYRDETGAVVRVPAAEAEKLRAEAARRMRAALNRVASTAEIWRGTHKEHLDMGHAESFGDLWDKPSRIFGVVSNIRAGVVPPPVSMWSHPIHVVGEARKALDAGNLAEAARLLRLAETHLKDAKQEWNTFLEASIGGAEKLVGELEVVRDTSFAIAIAAGGIVAAPLVAGAVGATGATGLGATALTAVGTGGVTMTGGALLRGSADMAGQATSSGKVDAGKTWKQVRSHLKDDFIAGAGSGAAKGVGQAFGVAKNGLSTTQAVVRNVAAQTTVTAATGTVGTVADTGLALAEGKSWEQARDEHLVPGLNSTAVSTVSAGASAPFGTLGQAVGKNNPLAGKALEYGGQALVAGGTTLAQGGSFADARRDALLAVTQSALMDKAQHPAGKVPAAAEGEPTKVAPPSVDTEPPAPAAAPKVDAVAEPAPAPKAPAAEPAVTAGPAPVPKPPVAEPAVAAGPAPVPKPPAAESAPAAPTPAASASAPGKRTPSAAKRLSEAGERIQGRAADKHQDAIAAEQKQSQKVDDAKARVARAQAAIAEREQSGGKPTKGQVDEQAAALKALTKASKKHEAARKGVSDTREAADTKAVEAERRKQALADAVAEKAAKKAAVPGGPADQVKAAWNSTAKKSIWKTFAAKEIADRLAGVSSAPEPAPAPAQKGPAAAGESAFTGKLSDWDPATAPAGFVETRKGVPGWEGIDPIKALTDTELAHVAATGELPERLTITKDGTRLGPELEHRIPQRVAGLLAEAGVPVDVATTAARLTDPGNLEPLFAEGHAVFDQHRNTGEARAQFDDRKARPLSRATDAELADIAAAFAQATNPQSPAAKELRDALRTEKGLRPSATWEVP